MNELKQRLLDGLKANKIKLNLQVTEFIGKDAKVDSFMQGQTTLPQFIEAITEADPYKIEELSDNIFFICNKSMKFPPFARITPEAIQQIWDHTDKLLKAYPELTDLVTATQKEINTANCSSCVKNSKTRKIFDEMLYLPYNNRDLTELEPILGRRFIETIKTEAPLPRPKPQPVVPPSMPERSIQVGSKQYHNKVITGNKTPRPSCFNCCRKHLAQAVILLAEAQQGYPNHKWLAVGHLAEASDEILEYPEIAALIRAERLNIMDNPDYVPNLMPLFDQLNAIELGIK